MRLRQIASVGVLVGAFRAPAHAEARDIGRATHTPDDWAAYGAGTTGCAADDDAHDVGRPPTLHGKIDSAAVADREVARGAGAGRIP
ncbi:hypothetical protein [Streptomyces sp. DSM 15324]|uniref:hypothetical protein n=1 Tax=Streptomyces sp. DSM 15324 TaxID=1739111 RepID=UPI000746FAD5|nr:hypothetical protein [Streptomyces sp. DSM 15324]KUO07065.1 hypothetical protein AQJ58_37125 [Streptomyces sp. DSM 15324]